MEPLAQQQQQQQLLLQQQLPPQQQQYNQKQPQLNGQMDVDQDVADWLDSLLPEQQQQQLQQIQANRNGNLNNPSSSDPMLTSSLLVGDDIDIKDTTLFG